MSKEDKAVALNLAKAYEMLPDEKKEFLLGYAEGVAAMAKRNEDELSAVNNQADDQGA